MIFIAISQTYHVVCPLLGLGIEAVLMLRIMPAQYPIEMEIPAHADIYVYVIARAGVIFGIYFTSCRYSGG